MNYYAGFGIVLLFFVGMYFDNLLKTGITCSIIGIFIGFIYIGYEIWKSLRK